VIETHGEINLKLVTPDIEKRTVAAFVQQVCVQMRPLVPKKGVRKTLVLRVAAEFFIDSTHKRRVR
jgi:hypothetical protein